MNWFSYSQLEQEIASLRYDRERMIERIKELSEMYKAGGLFEFYYLLSLVAEMLRAETGRK